MKPVCIITGAAGGIGSHLVAAYARYGYAVVMSDTEQRRMESVWMKGEMEPYRSDVIMVQADLTIPDEIAPVIQSAKSAFGRIDALINNAGIGINKSLYELSWEEWDRVMNTNLRAAFLCSREAAKVMKLQPQGGRIVNIASTRAYMSEPNTEAYAASKGGLVALTHALAASLSGDGITVNCICPGWIETGDYESLREEDHRQHWSGRVGRPADVAKACFYFTDPDNDFVTGTTQVVDGGMTHKMIYEP
ncbi:SDR family NAD(P)-dependent oxidoreductase [Paenibacillus tarimensis]